MASRAENADERGRKGVNVLQSGSLSHIAREIDQQPESHRSKNPITSLPSTEPSALKSLAHTFVMNTVDVLTPAPSETTQRN